MYAMPSTPADTQIDSICWLPDEPSKPANAARGPNANAANYVPLWEGQSRIACEIENAIGGENLAVKMFVKKGRWVYELLWEATELQQLLSVGCNMPHT